MEQTNTKFKEFLKHAKNYVSADIFSKGISFLTIPVFTRILVPEDYGILAVFSAIIAITTIVMGFGLRGAIGRYYYEESNEFGSFFGTNIVFVTVVNFILILFVFSYSESLCAFLNIDFEVFLIAVIVSFTAIYLQFYLAYLQASKKSRIFAEISVFKNVAITVFAIVLIVILENQKYRGKIYAQLFISGLVFIYIVIKIIKISKFEFKVKHLYYSLAFGLPIVFHLLSQYILSTSDKIIINQLLGGSDTGLYALAYQIGMIIHVITMGMLKSWTPMYYELMKKDQISQINELAQKYAFLVFSLSIGAILFSKEIITFMANKEYYDALNSIPIIILGYLFFFLYTLYVSYSFYIKKTYLITISTIISASSNVALNYIFIPIYGYIAAAYTTLIAYFILFILHYLSVRFLFKEKQLIPLPKLGIYLLFSILSVAVFHIVIYIDTNLLLSLLIKIISGIAFIYLMLSISKSRKGLLGY